VTKEVQSQGEFIDMSPYIHNVDVELEALEVSVNENTKNAHEYFSKCNVFVPRHKDNAYLQKLCSRTGSQCLQEFPSNLDHSVQVGCCCAENPLLYRQDEVISKTDEVDKIEASTQRVLTTRKRQFVQMNKKQRDLVSTVDRATRKTGKKARINAVNMFEQHFFSVENVGSFMSSDELQEIKSSSICDVVGTIAEVAWPPIPAAIALKAAKAAKAAKLALKSAKVGTKTAKIHKYKAKYYDRMQRSKNLKALKQGVMATESKMTILGELEKLNEQAAKQANVVASRTCSAALDAVSSVVSDILDPFTDTLEVVFGVSIGFLSGAGSVINPSAWTWCLIVIVLFVTTQSQSTPI